MHCRKDFFVHDVDFYTHVFGQGVHAAAESFDVDIGSRKVYHHHHDKVSGKNCLGDVGDVDFVLRKKLRYLCDDSDSAFLKSEIIT